MPFCSCLAFLTGLRPSLSAIASGSASWRKARVALLPAAAAVSAYSEMQQRDDAQTNKSEDSPAAASSSYSRRATLIFLGSIGVTLLITGATGSRMLKRASTKANAPSTPVPSAPPAFSMSKRSPRRLKDLFAITAATVPNDEKVLSKLDFRTNQQFTKSLPVPSLSGTAAYAAQAGTEANANEEDPAMGAILDAIKAFGIATFMLLGGTGLTAFLLARKFESTDVRS